MTRAVIYDRLSQQGEDPDERRGVVRMLRRMAEAEGWEVTEELTQDIGSSGWRAGRKAPGFDALLQVVSLGRADVVVCEEIDRLFRHEVYRKHLFDACVEGRVRKVAWVQGTDFDSLNPLTQEGERELRDRGQAAQAYSEALSGKLRRKYLDRQQQGRWNRGSGRPFGFDPVPRKEPGSKPGERTLVPRPEEARVVKEAAARIMRGESLTAVVRDLNDRGVRTPSGNRWRTPTFARVLRSPTTSGRREVFDYEFVKRPKAKDKRLRPVVKGEVEAEWPAILSPELQQAVREKLANGKHNGTWYAVRRYPLSGLVVCGGKHEDGSPCGAKMMGTSNGAYGCSTNGGGCGRVKVSADRTEEVVLNLVTDRWVEEGQPDSEEVPRTELTSDEEERLTRIADLEEQKRRLAVDYVDLGMDPGQFRAANERLDKKITKERSDLKSAAQAPARPPAFTGAGEKILDAFTYGERLKSRGLSEQEVQELHDWITSYVEKVTVKPSPKRQKGRASRWDPKRIKVTWRER